MHSDAVVDAASWARALLAAWRRPVAPVPGGGDRIVDWLESGAVRLTGRVHGPPLVPPGAAATAALGAEIAFASLAGEPPSRSWHHLLSERAALAALRRRGPWSVGGSCRAVAARDGWVAVNLARPDDVAAIPAVVARDVRSLHAAAAWELLEEWVADVEVAVAVDRLALLGVPAGAIPPSGQWSARDALPPGRAVAVARHVDVAGGSPRSSPPLVVDLSSLWAGPMCARLLATAGARVVKVELSGRLDGARAGNAAFYDQLHSGHDSVVVDVGAAADRRLLERLLAAADVVIEASRPRALLSLGIDPFEICGQTPTTWVSITGYGRTLPTRVGFGDDVAMAAGLVARDHDGVPMPCADAIADPLTGMHAAVAALASHRGGGSRVIDIAMRDVVAATVAWAPSPTLAAHRRGDQWVVDTGAGPQRVPAPREPSRVPTAAAPGRDTEAWRATLHVAADPARESVSPAGR